MINKINISPVKRAALTLPEPVRTLILSEADSMDSNEFVVKLGMWEKLLTMNKEAAQP